MKEMRIRNATRDRLPKQVVTYRPHGRRKMERPRNQLKKFMKPDQTLGMSESRSGDEKQFRGREVHCLLYTSRCV